MWWAAQAASGQAARWAVGGAGAGAGTDARAVGAGGNRWRQWQAVGTGGVDGGWQAAGRRLSTPLQTLVWPLQLLTLLLLSRNPEDARPPRPTESQKCRTWKTEAELTDTLLTFIEDNAPRRTAFGFTKGDVDNAGSTTGQSQDGHCERLAQKILIEPPSERWAKCSAKALVSSVKNQIVWLKTEFVRLRDTLGSTGYGLIIKDREDELWGDPQNVWQHIQSIFPWFKRMHLLLADSPVYDAEACTNSADSLDDMLLSYTGLADANSSIDDTSLLADYDGENDSEDDELKSNKNTKPAATVPAPAATSTKPSAGPASAPKRKRDTMVDTLTRVVELDHENKASLLLKSQEAKRRRLEAELKYKTIENDKQRVHEIKKMKLQVQLAQAQAAAAAAAAGGSLTTSSHASSSSRASSLSRTSSQAPFVSSSTSRSVTPFQNSDDHTPYNSLSYYDYKLPSILDNELPKILRYSSPHSDYLIKTTTD
ncbi:hypothetical protein GGX14DRAFT_557806 [Mycena pura]|uniref:Uncharacterized protein n=1 Tax=Mycena pura TaxID=153505 RepID=A0AAD6YLU7_9AGAR|nr:hypothetical protein GGX14DRAFT_557806 [Mycena pura]